jgi:hypothetical protein
MAHDNVSAMTNAGNDHIRFQKIKEAFERLPNLCIEENAEKALSGAGLFNWNRDFKPNDARDDDLLAYQVAYKVIAGVVRSGVPYVDNAGLSLIKDLFFHQTNDMLSKWNMGNGPLYTIFENLECGSPTRSRGFGRETQG